MDTITEPKYTDRLDQERAEAYANQMAVYAHATRSLPQRNSASSRPASRFLMGPPGGRGSLMVDEAWLLIDPKGSYSFPVVDPTHPENLYGTLGVDKCPGLPDAC